MSRESIASALKANRKRCKMSVDDVCLRLRDFDIDISAKTLYNYETGHRQPDADTLMALCDIYQIGDVLAEFGYKKEEPAAKSSELSEMEKQFIALPPNLRKEALRYLQFLSEQEGTRE